MTAAQAAAALAPRPQSVIVGTRASWDHGRSRRLLAMRPAATVGASLLDVASRTLPVFTLPWHYRSHDPRLIAAVNAVSYHRRHADLPLPGRWTASRSSASGPGHRPPPPKLARPRRLGRPWPEPSATAAEAGAAAAADRTGEDAAAVAAVSATRSALVAAAAGGRSAGCGPRPDSVAILVSNPDLVPMMTTALPTRLPMRMRHCCVTTCPSPSPSST